MIEVKDLVKRYGRLTALDRVSFTVKKGEILGLLGKNGAGKSTTMNLITGILSPDGGSVFLDGCDTAEAPAAAKKRIGYLPELPPLYPEMTVGGYLRFVYGLKKCRLPREQHLSEICHKIKIEDVTGRVIRNLSKGYRQRVGIAQALIGDPDILILDEPMTGLDPRQIVEIRQLILSLREKHTILLSSHILTEVQSVCDHIVVFREGRVVCDGTRETLLGGLDSGSWLKLRIEGEEERITALLGRIRGIRRVSCLGMQEKGSFDYIIDVEKGEDVRREIFRRLSKQNCPLLYMAPKEQTLENLFLQLTELK